tara:strand:+ start:251 stop:463 length:213 start_codon:yes stop_codon:yes gene_type:complete
MEQLTGSVGNPTALLIERIFWLGLGGFFGLAIISSIIRSINENKKVKKTFSPTELMNLAKKAIQQNSDKN